MSTVRLVARRLQWRYWTGTTEPVQLADNSTWMVMSHLRSEQDDAQWWEIVSSAYLMVRLQFHGLDDEVPALLQLSLRAGSVNLPILNPHSRTNGSVGTVSGGSASAAAELEHQNRKSE